MKCLVETFEIRCRLRSRQLPAKARCKFVMQQMTSRFSGFRKVRVEHSCATCKWFEQCPTPAASVAGCIELQKAFRIVSSRHIFCRSHDLGDAVPVASFSLNASPNSFDVKALLRGQKWLETP